MADIVHHHLEHMLPELDDLEKRGLFTRSEIREIVKKRRDFEYLLKRHSTLKQDYLRYIEYEKKLEALRKLRKKALVRDLKGAGEKWKNSLSDRASATRILLIYQRAVTRFKGDLSLWLQYLEYCRSQGTMKKMQKVATKCLQLHPNIPGLWMYMAAWEFEHNHNVTAARTLMQRGLRMCPHSENLWLEYFRMELTHMQQLKSRRLVMALEPTSRSAGETPPKGRISENHSSALRENDESSVEVVHLAAKDNEVPLEDKVNYKLVQTIFKNAVAAVPSSLGFRQRLLEVLDTVGFELKDQLEEQIQATITRDFPADESSWEWLARRHVESEGKAIQVFEDALQAIPSTRMYELFAKFLTELLDAEAAQFSSVPDWHSVDKKNSGHKVSDTLLSLYERCVAAQIFSESLAKGHLELLLRSGRMDEAAALGRKFCNMVELNKFPSLWEWQIALQMNRVLAVSNQDKETADRRVNILKLFQKALTHVPLGEAKRLGLMAMEYCTGQEGDYDVVVGMLETALSGGSGGKAGSDLACACVNWILHSQGIKQARRTYERFLSLPGPTAEFRKFCIALEAREVAAGCTGSFQSLRKLFNEAVEAFGQLDTDLWIEYYREELTAGNIDAANNVYWRAKKVLKDPTSFIERHQML